MLLENDANPSLKDCDGKNALHKCIQNINKDKLKIEKEKNNHVKTIKILMEKNPILMEDVDKNNKTPEDYFSEIKNYLNF